MNNWIKRYGKNLDLLQSDRKNASLKQAKFIDTFDQKKFSPDLYCKLIDT